MTEPAKKSVHISIDAEEKTLVDILNKHLADTATADDQARATIDAMVEAQALTIEATWMVARRALVGLTVLALVIGTTIGGLL